LEPIPLRIDNYRIAVPVTVRNEYYFYPNAQNRAPQADWISDFYMFDYFGYICWYLRYSDGQFLIN